MPQDSLRSELCADLACHDILELWIARQKENPSPLRKLGANLKMLNQRRIWLHPPRIQLIN
ncbi:hypothetical protein Leryth_001081 [Lithospermum erythrorhizon]|nr:hypothetical protein Leryth_001081 [Lithospermum erythrorhizon]